MKRILIKYCLSLILALSICIPAIANQKEIRKLEREIKYYDFTLQDVKKIINNDNFSGNLFLNFDNNEKKSGFFILEKKRSYLGFITILTDTSKIYEFCTFSISRAGKADFSKNIFKDAKASAQCQSSNYFKGVVISSKKSGEILELEINGQFKGKIDNQTNIKLKSFTDNNQLNESIKIINQFLEDKKNKTIVKLDQIKQENLEKELAAKKRAEEEKRQKELAAKKKAEEEKRQKELAAKKKAEEEKRQKELAAKKRAEEEKRQKELAAKKKAEEEKRQKELAAKKKAEEEKRQKELAAKEKAEKEKRQKNLDAKKKAEEEKRQKELEKQISRYKNISKVFIEDLKEFTKKPNKLDIIKVSELLNDFQIYLNSDWNLEKLGKFDALYKYVLTDKQFKSFHNKKIEERNKFIVEVEKDIKTFLKTSTDTLKNFIGENLGSNSAKIALNLVKKINLNLENFNIQNSIKLIEEVNKWKKSNKIKDNNKLSKNVIEYILNFQNSGLTPEIKKISSNKKVKKVENDISNVSNNKASSKDLDNSLKVKLTKEEKILDNYMQYIIKQEKLIGRPFNLVLCSAFWEFQRNLSASTAALILRKKGFEIGLKNEQFLSHYKSALNHQEAINTSSFLYKEYHNKHVDYIVNNIFNPLQISLLQKIGGISGGNPTKNKFLKKITIKCHNDLNLMLSKLKGLSKKNNDLIFNSANNAANILVQKSLELYSKGIKPFK